MREDYRNIPVGYVAKQALAWFLIIIGIIGFLLGIFMHYLGPREGFIWGLQALSAFMVADDKPFHTIVYRRSIAAFCWVTVAITVVGAFFEHAYYLLFGACLLFGLGILIVVLKPKNAERPPVNMLS